MDFQLSGWNFSKFIEEEVSPFVKLFNIFKELIVYTSGDFDEAIEWLRELDKEYRLTDENYTIDDFVNDLLTKGYVAQEINPSGSSELLKISSKMEKVLRKYAMDKIFGKIKKSKSGNHKINQSGSKNHDMTELRDYNFGDSIGDIAVTESLKNMYSRTGSSELNLVEDDLVVYDGQLNSQMSTVLMIDISHSMILYGEDRITPAKNVAMALSELITTRYPKDTLDIIVFGNDARTIPIK